MVDFFKRENIIVLWNYLRKGILKVFSTRIINKIVSMLSSAVITRLLSKSEYGMWSYILNFCSYANLVMGLGLIAGALQFGAENKGKPDECRFYKYCFFAGSVVNLFVALVFIAATFTNLVTLNGTGLYIRLYLPSIVLTYLIDLIMIILRCRNSFDLYSKLLATNTVFVATGTCIGALFGIVGIIICKYIAIVLSLILIIFSTRNIFPDILRALPLTLHQKKELWRYSIVNGVSASLNSTLYMIDVSMVALLMKSTVDLAIYKVATLIPTALTFIPNSVIICIQPSIISNNHNIPWLRKNIGKTFAYFFAVNVLISIVVIIAAPLIISILSGEQYISSVAPLRVLVLGYCISGTFRNLSVNTLAALRRVNYNAVCSVVTCISDIVFNYIFINKFGIIGAAYGTLCAETIASVLSFTYLLRILNYKK